MMKCSLVVELMSFLTTCFVIFLILYCAVVLMFSSEFCGCLLCISLNVYRVARQ